MPHATIDKPPPGQKNPVGHTAGAADDEPAAQYRPGWHARLALTAVRPVVGQK